MGRKPIGERAMTAADRQRRRRERLRPPYDPGRHALDLALELEERTDNVQEALQQLIAHLVVSELGTTEFVTTVVTEGWRSTVTVAVTENDQVPDTTAVQHLRDEVQDLKAKLKRCRAASELKIQMVEQRGATEGERQAAAAARLRVRAAVTPQNSNVTGLKPILKS